MLERKITLKEGVPYLLLLVLLLVSLYLYALTLEHKLSKQPKTPSIETIYIYKDSITSKSGKVRITGLNFGTDILDILKYKTLQSDSLDKIKPFN